MRYLFLFLAILSACGGGTSTGNPFRGTVQSSAYIDPNTTKMLSRSVSNFTQKSGYEFKLCVGAIAFENSQNERFETYLDNIGLVDLSDFTKTVTWGSVATNDEIEFDTIVISVVQDNALCGTDYSLSYEGQQLDVEFEFVFTLNELTTFNDGEYLRLDIQNIVEAVEDATNSGDFNDDDWLDYIDDFEGDFEEDDDEFDDTGTIGD